MKIRRSSSLTALIAAVALLATACSSGPPSLSLDRTVPSLSIPAEALAPVGAAEIQGILVGQLGRPVVINVWASWCAPCRAEAPLLQRAYKSFEGRVTFIGVASNDRAVDAAEFIERFGITYPNLLDDQGEVVTVLKMSNFPTTYVFGSDGLLRAKVTGGISEGRLAAVVKDALRG